jgi:hypothetical protein
MYSHRGKKDNHRRKNTIQCLKKDSHKRNDDSHKVKKNIHMRNKVEKVRKKI